MPHHQKVALPSSLTIAVACTKLCNACLLAFLFTLHFFFYRCTLLLFLHFSFFLFFPLFFSFLFFSFLFFSLLFFSFLFFAFLLFSFFSFLLVLFFSLPPPLSSCLCFFYSLLLHVPLHFLHPNVSVGWAAATSSPQALCLGLRCGRPGWSPEWLNPATAVLL